MLYCFCQKTVQERVANAIPLSMCKDEIYVKSLLSINGELLEYMSPEMKKKKSVFLTAISHTLNAQRFMAEELKMDKDVIRFMCRRNAWSEVEYGQIARYYKDDPEFLEEVNLYNPYYFNKPNWIPSRKLSLLVISTSCYSFCNRLHKFWSNDREIALAAVKAYGKALQYVSDELKRDEEVVVAALEQDGRQYKFATAFQQNRDVLLRVVKRNGLFFQHLDYRWRDDMEFALEAVKTCAAAYLAITAYTKCSYQNNKLILRANGYCLHYLNKEYLSEEKDDELVEIAVRSNPMVVDFLPKAIQERNTANSETILRSKMTLLHPLESIIKQSELVYDKEHNEEYHLVDQQWIKEKEWAAAFTTHNLLYMNEWNSCIVIPEEKYGIIENRELLLVLLKRGTTITCNR